VSNVLKLCDIHVGVVPVVMWVQVYYLNEEDSLYIPLAAGGRLLQAGQQAIHPGQGRLCD